MKKLLAFFAAAAILFACGCGSRQADTQTQTEPVSAALTDASIDEDLALPADGDGVSTTAPVVPETTQPTAAPTTAPPETTAAAEPPATEKPTETTTEKPTETTTVPTTETTTEAPKAENFEKRVLGPINSGKYTMTLGAIGDDRKNEDKIVKSVRDGESAYWVTVPGINLSVRVFPNEGKYYAAIPGKYAELTKEQYDVLQKRFDGALLDLPSLQYQKTESAREKLKRYTIETFDMGGKPVSFWYENGSLFRREMDGIYQPIAISDTPMYSYFDLEQNAEQVDGETLASVISLAGAFFE